MNIAMTIVIWSAVGNDWGRKINGQAKILLLWSNSAEKDGRFLRHVREMRWGLSTQYIMYFQPL